MHQPRRSRLAHLPAVLTAAALLVAACGSGGAAETPAPAEPASPTPAPQAPLAFEMRPHRLLPADYAAAVLDGVDRGAWSLDEGLVQALTTAAGQQPADSTATFRMASGEATGLVRLARHYLASAPDSAAGAEIARLLSALVPSPAALAAYGAPESAQSSRPAGPARPRSQTNCRDLATRGFPADEATMCLLYRTVTVQGDEYLIYYPADWAPSHPFRAYLDYAAQAIQDAVNTYSDFGEMGPGNVFFSVLTSAEDFGTREESADAVADPAADGSCQVVIYPNAIADGAAEDYFKQVVAHEFFHCYEFDNLTRQERGPDPDATAWWVEGAAEYFSNVVYPATNAEHDWIEDFNTRSESTSLLDMSYEDNLFFQYLENRDGPAGVLALLESMPTSGGREAQLAALAGYSDMPNVFHEFARAYLDNTIRDTSGRGIGILYGANLGPVTVVEGPLPELAAADPFVLRRLRLGFVPGKTYEGMQLTVDGDGLQAARPADAPGDWPGLPSDLRGGCPAVLFAVAVTTIAEPTAQLALDATVSGEVDEDLSECEDPCLVGTWVLDNATYENYFNATMGGASDVSYLGATGTYTATFDREATASATIDAFTVRAQMENFSSGPLILTLTMNGVGAGTYWPAGGVILTTGGDYDFTLDGTMEAGGASMPIDPMNFADSAFGSGDLISTASYICTDEILYWTPPIPGLPIGVLEFNRVGE